MNQVFVVGVGYQGGSTRIWAGLGLGMAWAMIFMGMGVGSLPAVAALSPRHVVCPAFKGRPQRRRGQIVVCRGIPESFPSFLPPGRRVRFMSRYTFGTNSLSPSQLERALEMLPTSLAVMIWGPPGIGKSTVVRKWAAGNGMEFIRLPLASMEAADLIGLPTFQDGFTSFAEPRRLWELTTEAEDRRRAMEPKARTRAVLFLDELPQASPQVLHALSALILDRTLGFGGLNLADGVRIVAAGNRLEDGAFANPLGTHLRSRMIDVHLAVSLTDWRDYARRKGMAPEILAFISSNQRWLHAFQPEKGEGPFACPRSWEFASDIVKRVSFAEEQDRDLVEPILAGTVGTAAAVEFMAFLEAAHLCPSADSVVADPSAAPTFHDRPDLALLVLENLILACREDWSCYLDGTLRYAARLSPELRAVLSLALLEDEGPGEMKEAVLASPHLPLLKQEIQRLGQVSITFDRIIDA